MKLSIIITCHGEARELPCILEQLNNQRKNVIVKCSRTGVDVRWGMGDYYYHQSEIIVVNDGEFLVKYKPMISDLGVSRVISMPKEGGVGHHTRQPGIEAATGDFIILTNQDNYFVAGWADMIVRNITSKTGIVYWNCINNLWNWSNLGGSKLERGRIDLCCVAVESSIAKKVGFPFRNYDGDFDYIKACADEAINRKLEIKKINCDLSIHN